MKWNFTPRRSTRIHKFQQIGIVAAMIGYIYVVLNRGSNTDNLNVDSGQTFEEFWPESHELRPADKPVNDLPNVTLEDVIGNHEAKTDVQDIMDFLSDPDKYHEHNARIPRGFMFAGPPGVGKTYLAKAVANECNVPFLSAPGSTFSAIFVGLGAQKVRELFARANELGRCIIYIDEIDAVGGKRENQFTKRFYLNQELNELFVQIDGFDTNNEIIVIASTNMLDSLDPALLRSGRFDRKIHFHKPLQSDREQLLEHYMKGRKTQFGDEAPEDVWAELASLTTGVTGADVKNICNLTALNAGKERKEVVTKTDLVEGIEQFFMGRKDDVIVSQHARYYRAHYEAGKVLAALYIDGSLPVIKSTIEPRGGKLGQLTQQHSEKNLTKKIICSRMLQQTAGIAAQRVKFGDEHVSNMGHEDLANASNLAVDCFGQFGFSETLGNRVILDHEKEKLSDYDERNLLSESLAFVNRAADAVTRLLQEPEMKERQDRIAQALMENMTLGRDELYELAEFDPETTELFDPITIIKQVPTPDGIKEFL